MSKPELHLAKGGSARSLAKMYERMTGNRVSPAEIAAAQKLMDSKKAGLKANPTLQSKK